MTLPLANMMLVAADHNSAGREILTHRIKETRDEGAVDDTRNESVYLQTWRPNEHLGCMGLRCASASPLLEMKPTR